VMSLESFHSTWGNPKSRGFYVSIPKLPINKVIGANRHVRFTPESRHVQCN
jgi:hypothetical protein